MIHYGGNTPKRHYALGNSSGLSGLWSGKLRGWKEKKKALQEKNKSVDLVIKYIDKNGQRRWKGSKHLRASEMGP